jgi:CubicO group peptidase (beta-lactamase class C family)
MDSRWTLSRRWGTPVLITSMFLAVWSTGAPTTSQQASVTASATARLTSSSAEGPTDPSELASFLDDFIGKQMQEKHIAGGAISVVKDGKLFFARGYGYADVDKRVPVDPEQTMFGIGSVSKTFTWTAVMQLVEQGKVDLDADVNTYLDFQIPATYPQPITVKNLITHTSGFEDKLLGSLVADARDVVPPRDWLLAHLPMRMYPPGTRVGYANYNAILAGYIVSRVSGQPFDQYVQQHILDPLGMTHSTAQWPVPPELRANLSVGYTFADGAFKPFPDYLAQPAGIAAGGLHASVTDMARYMIAHLEGGRYSDASMPEARILQEATARQMQTTLYTPDPRMLGAAYGFFDWSDNGQRTLGHEGYLPPMHSELLLLPDQHLGIFVSFNSADAGELVVQHTGLQKAFFDHYYPSPAITSVRPPADFAKRADQFTGVYRFASSPHTSLIKIVELFGAYRVEISNPGDGTLLLNVEGLRLHFVEAGPLYFRQTNGPFAMLFHADDRGRITEMYTDLVPEYTMVKLQWYETTGFNLALALGCVLAFLSMLLVAAIRAIRGRLKSDAIHEPRGARIAQSIITAICLLNLLFLVGTALWGNPTTELHDVSLTAKIVLGLGVVSAILTVGAVLYSLLAWKDRYWGVVGRAYYTLVTLAAIAFVWLLNYWNLLGWRF